MRVFLKISLLLYLFLVIQPYAVCYEIDEVEFFLEKFASLSDISFSERILKENLSEIPVKKNLSLEDLLPVLKKAGFPVGIYELVNIEDVYKKDVVFITYDGNQELILVNLRKDIVELYYISGKYVKVSIDKFSKLYSNRKIISRFLCSVWLGKDDFGISSNEFYIIYSYHNEKNFKELEEKLVYLKNKAAKGGRRLIYIDELGLIPKDTVKKRMEMLNISEKEAFNQIKQAIFKENEMLEKGIPINTGPEFYRELYKWLAKYKFKSLVEDLKYDNWSEIVKFDELKLYDIALMYFIMGNMEKYLDVIEEYRKGFWTYNARDRDDNFLMQVLDSLKQYPDALIFTIRGMGHLGLEEKLAYNGVDVKFSLIGDGILEHNLINQQILDIYYSLGIDVFPEEEFLSKIVPEKLYRDYYIKIVKLPTAEAVLKVKPYINEITFEDVGEISNYFKEKLFKGELTKQDAYYQFIHSWFKENKAAIQ